MSETEIVTEQPPNGYSRPEIVWSVEYVDAREPASMQIGAFATQEEADKLLRKLEANGSFAELHVNLIPVHRNIEDWEWDR